AGTVPGLDGASGYRLFVLRHPQRVQRRAVGLPRLRRHDGEVRQGRAARLVLLEMVPFDRQVVADLVVAHEAHAEQQVLVAEAPLLEATPDLLDAPFA